MDSRSAADRLLPRQHAASVARYARSQVTIATMSTHHAKSAKSTSPRIPTVAMSRALDTLHGAFLDIIVDPTDSRLYERVDETCYVIWEWCLEHGATPWSWCLDVYCSCKVALAEHEPNPFPQLEELRPLQRSRRYGSVAP